jgi:hypothetical protein
MSPEIATSETESAAPKRRRRFRFGLRGLIVMVTLAAIVFAPLGVIARRKQREQLGIQALTDAGAFVARERAKTSVDAIHQFLFGVQWSVVFRAPHVQIPELHLPCTRPPVVYSPTTRASELNDDQVADVVLGLHYLGSVDLLFIESASLTDDGLVEFCEAPQFAELDLRCPLVTSRGTDALQQKFPKLVILDD